ncbi:MAG: hypothetical protein ACF8OB_10450 [Phycisphaeraceae bacterium JB051]
MLTHWDYVVIVFYFLFVGSLGFVFRHFNKDSTNYFAGGQRTCWWLLGGSMFISNFSSWTFTGAAGIAYKYGILIFYVYLMDVLGYIIGYLFFATRLRQMRLITNMDGVRRRYGRFNEQFFTWYSLLQGPLIGAVWLFSLSLILSVAFDMPKNPVIIATGVTVLIMALLGGSWAVMASDFIQMLLLMCISLVTAVLVLIKIGGVGALIAQIPDTHFQIFFPLGSIKYDWLFLISTVIGGVLMRNSMMTAGKYIAAKDSKHAKRAALVPLIGYSLLPAFWFVPPLAVFTLVPDFAAQYAAFDNPEEASYIAVALNVLPQGLQGLLIVGLFAATMSSMDTSFNKTAGVIVKNVYASIIRPKASDKEQLLAGQIATVGCGVAVIVIALVLANVGKISIFDMYLYIGALFGCGSAIVFLMGMFIRRTPAWVAWSCTLIGSALSYSLFVLLRGETAQAMLLPTLEDWPRLLSVYNYILVAPFFMTNMIVAPACALFYLLSMRFYKRGKKPAYDKQVDELFVDMQTPVDFEKEVGGDNAKHQARTLGGLSIAYGIFILTLVFIPNPMIGRIAILACAAVMLVIGWGLWRSGGASKTDGVAA